MKSIFVYKCCNYFKLYTKIDKNNVIGLNTMARHRGHPVYYIGTLIQKKIIII